MKNLPNILDIVVAIATFSLSAFSGQANATPVEDLNVDEGIAKNLSSTTLRDDAYAFIFDQQGLMAGLSIEGTKITHIKKP